MKIFSLIRLLVCKNTLEGTVWLFICTFFYLHSFEVSETLLV